MFDSDEEIKDNFSNDKNIKKFDFNSVNYNFIENPLLFENEKSSEELESEIIENTEIPDIQQKKISENHKKSLESFNTLVYNESALRKFFFN